LINEYVVGVKRAGYFVDFSFLFVACVDLFNLTQISS